MRIAYDHQIFAWQEYGGISRYFYEIASRMQGVCECQVKIFSPLYINRYLKDNPLPYTVGVPFIKIPKIGRALQTICAPVVRCLLYREAPDVVHETYYYDKKLSPPKTRSVLTVHDMIHEIFPHFFHPSDVTRAFKKKAVNRADHIICVSENTRRDLIDILGVEKSRTSVVHLGHSLAATTVPSEAPAFNRPYIAYVGLRHRYKNFVNLLHAYASSTFLRNNFTIVCFGGSRLKRTEHNEIADLKLNPDCIVQLNGSDDILAGIYKHASVFVCPSLYEGFGIPPLEAMSFGCPVACSSTSSLQEVCGRAAEYFDPNEIESIRIAIERVIKSTARRNELIDAGYIHVRNFSWDNCTRQTAVIYSELL